MPERDRHVIREELLYALNQLERWLGLALFAGAIRNSDGSRRQRGLLIDALYVAGVLTSCDLFFEELPEDTKRVINELTGRLSGRWAVHGLNPGCWTRFHRFVTSLPPHAVVTLAEIRRWKGGMKECG